jgi:hypothetical protein
MILLTNGLQNRAKLWYFAPAIDQNLMKLANDRADWFELSHHFEYIYFMVIFKNIKFSLFTYLGV